MMEKYLNKILIGLICIIIVIVLLDKKNNICQVEGFLTAEKKHVPRNFELYEINNKKKYMSFIFNSPRPYIIGNMVIKYELILISYKKEEGNTHHNTVIHIKDIDDVKPDSEDLHKKGKYLITIRLPELTYEKMEEDGIIQQKPLNYKIGLRAIYPNNISSSIVQTLNQNLFVLGTSFNYKNNKYLLEFGRKCKDELENETIKDIQNIQNIDPQYERMSDILGGYPDNLILNKNVKETFLKSSFSGGNINARVNENSFSNI